MAFLVFFVCVCQSKFIRLGVAILLLVSLKRNSTRIARVVFPLFLLRIYGTNELIVCRVFLFLEFPVFFFRF